MIYTVGNFNNDKLYKWRSLWGTAPANMSNDEVKKEMENNWQIRSGTGPE